LCLHLEENDLNQGRPGLTCTLCGDCIGQCPNGLIGYRFPGMRPEQARTAFIILIVSIHTLFLGVARI
jgi:ferredoxin